MTKILMPIKPKYVKEILEGNKKYEYRKSKPKKDNLQIMLIYETAPIMKVVGEVEIKNIIEGDPENIWNKTKDKSGLNKEKYDAYYKNVNKAYAYQLGKVTKYDNPINLKEIGINYLPQSFIYID